EFVRRHGVRFQLGVAEHFSIAALKQQGFKYIFLGIGAGRARHLKLDQGEDRVLDALNFLQNFRQNGDYKLGKNVAVIGGGNSAMDAARAALRCEGVESVHIVYRRTRTYMPADKEEFDAAISEGVRFHELLLPVAFSGGRLTCQRMALGEPDSDGRRKVHPVEGAFQTLTIDTVISAIGEQVEREVLEKNGLRFDHQGRLVVDPATGETSVENVFIGGDALRGPSTVVESIADGKRAAEVIMRREQIEPDVLPDFRQKFDSQQRLIELRGRKGNIVPFNAQDHHQEAARCLACNFVCDKCVEVCPNRANVAIAVPGFHDSYQIIHMDALCNECGNCETFCPYSGAPYKEKITVFWTEADFLDSTNDGFYLMSRNGSFDFRTRLNGTIGTIQLDKDGKVLKSTYKENSPEFNAFLQILKTVHGQHSYLLPESSS
ncbi:MAG TPA: putative selenate reductase subunit YgfK, partial [Caldithrix abyssi]|nr:putative selenate reductase subunit YgfK [Caldithrix abyssi]